MKKNLFLIVFLIGIGNAFSQDYDLIITTEGDSIACHIDSITDTHIYFEMKANYYWTHTHMDVNKVSEFKRLELDRKTIRFKRGTSILLPSDQVTPGPNSMREIPKNSLILANDFLFSITISYERLIPVHDRIGFMLRGGTGITLESGEELVFMGQVSTLFGKRRHFLETGVGYYQTLNYSPSFFPLIGYRYMGFKGLSVKASIRLSYYTEESWVDEWGQGKLGWGISIGYRFWL